jgi:photosystem II stability/assembly factor-like uncharacterized protein
VLLSLLVLLLPQAAHSQAAKTADIGSEYEWGPMKIGGGGWIVGLNINPAAKGLLYARTDVSGAYRWNPATSSWKQIVTARSLPAEYVGYGKYCGVDSIVGAPSDAKVAYMMFAAQPYTETAGQVFRSVNQGETWTATNFKATGVKVEANGEGRQEGERLSVDPVNSNVVYFGSIRDGLWFTENGGANWTKVDAIPNGKAPHGVNTVVFDHTSGTLKAKDGTQRTKVAYVSVEEGGVFRTDDAGATWKKISDTGAGDSGKPRDATVGKDGTYYVVYDNAKGATGAVWKYSAALGWSDITPQGKEGGKEKPYWAITVDPFDPQHLVAMIHGGRTFVSSDQGATWAFHSFTLKSPKINWLGTQTNYFLSTGQLAFDPHEKGKLWYAEGFGVWWTNDLTPNQIPWNAASEGIEECCGNDVIAPPGGKPVAAMWDVGVFHFSDVDTYTAKRSQPGFMSAWALDWCPRDPKFLVAVFRSHLDFVQNAKSSGYSTDGGMTWTRFPAVEKGMLPKELDYGVIAVSANNPDRIVWCPTGGKLPYYTADRGATWTQANFGGAYQTGHNAPYTSLKPLCADRVAPDTFYFYTPQDGVFRSTDGGATFAKTSNPLPNRWNAILKATPGHARDLWFAAGTGGGLYHSTDGGTTWTQVTGISAASNVGFGKAKSGDYPTLFVAGSVAGSTGIFRSTDKGVTWEKVVDYPLGIFDTIDALDGDKDIFGQVYVCFTSAGFAYGKPKAAVK